MIVDHLLIWIMWFSIALNDIIVLPSHFFGYAVKYVVIISFVFGVPN